MNGIQLGAWVLALIFVFVLPYFSEFNPGTEEISNSFALGPMFPSLFILIIPVTAVVFLVIERVVQRKRA